eukprot:3725904-Pyramimonas_sp.AAC.1
MGNRWADFAAKRGLHCHDLPAGAFKKHGELLLGLRQVAAWIANSQAFGEERAPDMILTVGRKPRRAGQTARPERVKEPHPAIALGASPRVPILYKDGWKCA